MIACDSITYGNEWFHVKCMYLSKIPKGKGKCYFTDCQKLKDGNKRLRMK